MRPRSELSVVGLKSLINGYLLRKSFSIPMSCKVQPFIYQFYCFRFQIEVFDPLEFNFCAGQYKGVNFDSACGHLGLAVPFVEDGVLSPVCFLSLYQILGGDCIYKYTCLDLLFYSTGQSTCLFLTESPRQKK